MRLELAGVTLDSSTDDLNSIATTCGRRKAHRHRNDLSMDSGIQGSSFDLAAASSGSDLEENMDDDSLNRYQTHGHVAHEAGIWHNHRHTLLEGTERTGQILNRPKLKHVVFCTKI